MKRIYIAATAVLVLFVASAIVAAQPAEPQITNGELDKPYTRRGADEVMIANGWSDPVWRGRRPECKPDTDIARNGEAQKCFVRFDDLYTAIGQQPTNLQAGDTIRVVAWAYPWSSQKDDVTRCQDWSGNDVNFGKLAARVCVNWWGADPFNEPYSTACSVQALECAKWNRLEVVTQVQSPNAKIWLLTESRVKASHQDIWWDDVSIERVDPGNVTPQPTQPCPTPQPCPTSQPGDCASVEDVQRIVDEREPVRWPR